MDQSKTIVSPTSLNRKEQGQYDSVNKRASSISFHTNSQYGGQQVDPTAKAKLMQEARFEKDQKRLQLLQMEARIKKLQLEEEKAKKRINDAKKQQQFIEQMKQEKIRKQEERQKALQEMQAKEEENRRKILEDRIKQKEMLQKSQVVKYETNRKVTEDVKEQKNRIKVSIEMGKMTYIEEKQKVHTDHQIYRMSQKQLKQIQEESLLSQSSKVYNEKIEKAKQEALEYERKMRELEERELQLLGKLQKTQLMESSEFTKLQALKTQSQTNSKFKNSARYSPKYNGPTYKPLVLVGPSGAGKSTLTEFLMENYKNYFEFSVSSTTRDPRPGEHHGLHYYFIKRSEFEQEIQNGDFLEYNEVHGNFYGTSKSQIQRIQQKGKICILDIDVKGARDIHKNGTIPCHYILVKTATIDELRKRLEARGTETEETLKKRVGNAEKEIQTAEELGIFQKTLINDKKEQFIQEAENYLKILYGIKKK